MQAQQESREATGFDYDNNDWPRDFDIRIEVAEQKEVLERSSGKLKQIMHCSEYVF